MRDRCLGGPSGLWPGCGRTSECCASAGSVLWFDLTLQVLLPADLTVGIPQPQLVFSFPHSGQVASVDLGWGRAVPGGQDLGDYDASSNHEGKGQQGPQQHPAARRAHHSTHSASCYHQAR